MTEEKLYATTDDWLHSDKESDKPLPPLQEPAEDLVAKTKEAIRETAEEDIRIFPSWPGNYTAASLAPPSHQEKKRFFSAETRGHWGCLKDIVIGTYHDSRLPKPIAAVEGVLYAVVFDFTETVFRTYDKCLGIKDWFQEDPDKLENPFE